MKSPLLLRRLILGIAALILVPARAANIHAEKNPDKNPAYEWLDIALEVTGNEVARNGARPTVLSRTLAIYATAVYDAWAAYDATAVGTRLGGALRRPASEHTEANKAKAIAHAAYRSLAYVHPEDIAVLNAHMKRLGFDPANTSTDLTRPEGIGNVAAQAVIDYRKRDGANQAGDEPGSNGKPYSDYTGYQPVNTVDKVNDPDRWQPITFTKPDGTTVTPGFLTPHWFKVKPFALKSGNQFLPPPPPKVGSEQLKKEVVELIQVNGSLTEEQKAVVEFMRDGPRSTGQSGHWLRFAQDVSRRDRNTTDEDVKLFFAVANVAFDAFISCWDCKRTYDNSRPWTLIRSVYAADESIRGYGGPCAGVVEKKGKDWLPYSPANFITPPFPAYTSGHSTVSSACANILRLFTGSDDFGFVEVRKAGQLTEEKCVGKEIRLDLPTFTATAEMAAVSRMWGGYHIRTDNEVGLDYGKRVALFSWPVYETYFNGTAAAATAVIPASVSVPRIPTPAASAGPAGAPGAPAPAGASAAPDYTSPLKNIALAGEGGPTLSLGGKLRARTEHWENFAFGPANDDDFQLYRAFLNADLRLSPALRVFVEGKTAHGDGRDLPGGNRNIDTDSLDLHQAHVDLTATLGEKHTLTLRPGRQELQYGKQRLISPLDWVNTRRSFDAVKASYVNQGLQVDAFASQLVQVDRYRFNDGDAGEDFHGVYATDKLGDTVSLDLYALYLDKDVARFGGSTNTEERVTLGARVWGKPAGTALDYDAEFAYQTGEFGDKDIQAWMAALEIGCTGAALPGKPRVYAGYDYASGDANGKDGDVETFNQLYPLGHAYFGFIDLVGRQNIQDVSVGITAKPHPRLMLKLDGHWFTLADDADALYNAGGAVARPGGKGEDDVGAELDFLAKLDLDKHTALIGGFSRFFVGDFVKASGPHDDVDFLYASLEFSF